MSPAGCWNRAAWRGVAERKPATRRRPVPDRCGRPCVREPRGLVVGGGIVWVGSGQGPQGLVACDRASPGQGKSVMNGLRAVVCVCAHAARTGRVPLPLTKLQWSSSGSHRAPALTPGPCLLRRPIPASPPPPRPQSPSPQPFCSRQRGTGGTGYRVGRVAATKVLPSALSLVRGCLQTPLLRRGCRRPEIARYSFRDPQEELVHCGQDPRFQHHLLCSSAHICPFSRPECLPSRQISPKETRNLGNCVSAEAVQWKLMGRFAFFMQPRDGLRPFG